MIITISGRQGAGKTTLAKSLAKRLGYEFISIGDLQGELALEKGMTITELMTLEKTQPQIHREIDEKTRKLGETKNNFVVEGWIAYHFIPSSYKIFLTVDEKIGCARIFNDYRPDEPKKETLEKTLENQRHRLEETQKGFQKAHGIDFLDQSQYDFVLDTSFLNADEVLNKLEREVRYAQNNI
ncbi:cytidylate kinase family protein [Candidatus Pacearchaeota archaeon]|nr:cytidylate kinase family protein [Candidatus Pacearchaeota archaeon]